MRDARCENEVGRCEGGGGEGRVVVLGGIEGGMVMGVEEMGWERLEGAMVGSA